MNRFVRVCQSTKVLDASIQSLIPATTIDVHQMAAASRSTTSGEQRLLVELTEYASCSNYTCKCDEGWSGQHCETPLCANGTCDMTPDFCKSYPRKSLVNINPLCPLTSCSCDLPQWRRVCEFAQSLLLSLPNQLLR